MIPLEWIQDAARRISAVASVTPVSYDSDLDVFLKWENKQVTGSFKLRGALNKILCLADWERAQGLVTASAGNHGQGVALAARETRARVVVFASEHAAPAKLAAMRALGAELRLVAGGYAEAESAGIAFAKDHGMIWISPYNDGLVIAGQGTVGLELMEQIQPFTARTVVVPVGGGGLISGIGAALSARVDRPRLVGVQSEASAFMYALFNHRAQRDVMESDSIADGLAGWVEDESMTIPLVRKFVDDIILVTEEEIERAIVFAWEKYGEVIEGSAAVSIAAVLSGRVTDRPAVLIITGGNIQPELHWSLIEKWGRNSPGGGR
jgi:threonine dehydratase